MHIPTVNGKPCGYIYHVICRSSFYIFITGLSEKIPEYQV